MTNKTKLILLCLSMSLFWLIPAQAQESENDGIARVAIITPKEGHDETLVKAITDYHHWVANFEGHHEYTWYRILTGPNTGKYVARTSGHNWADFDAEYDWEQEADEVFQRNVAPHIQNMTVEFNRDMKNFSNWPENFEGYTHFTVQDWHVKNGQYGKFRKGLKKITETLKAGGFPNHFGFLDIVSGGYGGQIRLVSANKGWSDMADEDPSFFTIMSEALGGAEEFEAFMSDWGSTFKPGKNWMVRYMPEASDYGK